MEIAVLLGERARPEVLLDTIESVQHWMTRNILIVLSANSPLKSLKLPAAKLVGCVHHGWRWSYRNFTLGLSQLFDTYPECDWFCYLEPNSLVASDRFVRNLEFADQGNVWLLGSNGYVDEIDISQATKLIDLSAPDSYHMDGCCLFFSRKFLEHLKNRDFFDKLLTYTNRFSDGEFHKYPGTNLSEHLYPTLARLSGGNLGVFATYDERGRWHGAFEKFPLRMGPDLDPEKENFQTASLLHPLPSYNHPLRVYLREKRLHVV